MNPVRASDSVVRNSSWGCYPCGRRDVAVRTFTSSLEMQISVCTQARTCVYIQ